MNSDIAIVLKHLSGTVDVIDFNPSLKKSRVTCTIHNGTFPWKHNPWVTICVKFWQLFLHYLCKLYPQVTVIEKPVLKIYIVFIRQKVSQMSLYNRLAWKPSVTRGNHRYSRSLPALGRKLRFGLFFSIKVDPLNLESLNQAKNIPVGLPSSPITIWCTIV